MKLSLKNIQNEILEVKGAFLKIKTHKELFYYINSLNISPKNLDIYNINENFFVIFKTTENINLDKILKPFKKISEKLYIPLNYDIFPKLNSNFIDKNLIYDNNAFVPDIGLIALKESLKINLEELLFLAKENTNNWTLAKHGLIEKPKLIKLEIKQPKIEDIFASIQEFVSSLPIQEINKKETKTAFLKEKIKLFFLNILYYLVKRTKYYISHPLFFRNFLATILSLLTYLIFKNIIVSLMVFFLLINIGENYNKDNVISAVYKVGNTFFATIAILLYAILCISLLAFSYNEKNVIGLILAIFLAYILYLFIKKQIKKNKSYASFSNNNYQATYKNKIKLLEKFENWLEIKLDKIDEARNIELNKLVKMLDTNPDEALKYAISLNSPYLNRGDNKGFSTKLTKNIPLFNSNSFNISGNSFNTWNTNKYYSILFEKYMKIINKELENKNYKRAAYIYANLLGNFNSAANVLEQGGFYRDAAFLYKNHVKNNYLAATCLEKGNFLDEAIELYLKDNYFEKAGDLYIRLNNKEKAHFYYEKVIKSYLDGNYYLLPAYITDKKLNDLEKAKKILLEGWEKSYEQEDCLKEYLYIYNQDNKALSKEIENIYTNKVKENNIDSFFNVILPICKNNNEILYKNSPVKNILYEIISKKAKKGDNSKLIYLKDLLVNDKLLYSDANRFISNDSLYNKKEKKEFILNKKLEVLKSISIGDTFIIFGVENDKLNLIRGNLTGYFEYYIWDKEINHNYSCFSFIYDSNNIFIRLHNYFFEEKILIKNNYFSKDLIIKSSNFIDDNTYGITIKNNTLVSLTSVNELFFLNTYKLTGELVESIECYLEEDIEDNILEYIYNNNLDGLISFDNKYYCIKDYLILIINKNKISIFFLDNEANSNYCYYNNQDKLKIALKNNTYINVVENFNNTLLSNQKIKFESYIKDMKFINENQILIASYFDIYIYDLVKNRLNKIHTSKEEILCLIETNKRATYAFLDSNSKITLFY
ncbi:MAG: hypothetical protein U0457_19100 [Candidatus Sericytochromatia bacterium]